MKILNRSIGEYGEALAKTYLMDHGYLFIEANFSCKIGEIDIIARDGDYICFIEVKSRYNKIYGSPLESITPSKCRKIYRVAEYYIAINQLQKSYFRFDAIEINIFDNSYNLNLVKNAF